MNKQWYAGSSPVMSFGSCGGMVNAIVKKMILNFVDNITESVYSTYIGNLNDLSLAADDRSRYVCDV
jgi:hypothetical protein